MPVFNAHIPANRFSPDQKRALADALNQSLVEALGIPEGDRFIVISEHGDSEIFLEPTFMGMQRSSDAVIIRAPSSSVIAWRVGDQPVGADSRAGTGVRDHC
ncbi:tautomerase family protein, partial [Streptomyces sp. NPDC004393]|uniref:tautomerase family protein n=1 Tax=Streptomyces sp. NPDC004533 TaxID=3154278 RepID=UPI0033B42146